MSDTNNRVGGVNYDGDGDGDEGVEGDDGGRAFVLEATKEWEHREQKACHVCCTLPVTKSPPFS